MYLMQLAKVYLRDSCFKKCFIKILNSIAKFIACVVTYLCSGGHPRRRHSGQESPATRGGAATWPWAPGHPRWWWRGQSPPLPPLEGERARAQGPRAAGAPPEPTGAAATGASAQEPPPAAHPHRRQIQPWGARIRQGGGRIGPRRPAAVRNDMIVGRKEEGVGRVR